MVTEEFDQTFVSHVILKIEGSCQDELRIVLSTIKMTGHKEINEDNATHYLTGNVNIM